MIALVFSLTILLACSEKPAPWSERWPSIDTDSTGNDTSGDTSQDSDTGDDTHEDTVDDTVVESGDSTVDTVDSGETPWTLPPRPDTDHPELADSWRWGGGQGYPDLVDPDWPVVTRVATQAALVAALESAVAGDVVWVEEGAEIDLTGLSLCVNAGVWLASGRGQEGASGGLLFATEGASSSVLMACGDDVRITGLRIRGPDPETCPDEWPDACPEDVSGDPNCAYCTRTAYGISVNNFAGLEVDNNELSGWTYAAVGVHDATSADVHHNHIHHGWREGLGYGVVVYGSGENSALIRWNRFDEMRHVVAGQGFPTEDYEARDNLMGASAISHVYDMHGQDEALDDGSSYAGGEILVHGNIVLVSDETSLVVRGRPAVGSWFYDNCLGPDEDDAYDQRYFYGNFHVDTTPDGTSAPNAYGQSAGDCGTLHWCLSDGVTGPVRYGSAAGTAASELLVGDMDGDGRDDVFGTTGSSWRWANPDGGTWSTLATSSVDIDQLHLGDLDGDGIDDVFYATGSAWQWSRSGTSSWATLRSSAWGAEEVALGDFDGDGAMDVFYTDDSRWWYVPHGSGTPVGLALADTDFQDLALGDFDGDGITDVFTADGSSWRWSRSGSSSWASLATSSTRVGALAFADVDGDRITDVLYQSGESLLFSSGGRSSWATLRHQRESLDDLRLGDWNGDGRADLLVGGCL